MQRSKALSLTSSKTPQVSIEHALWPHVQLPHLALDRLCDAPIFDGVEKAQNGLGFGAHSTAQNPLGLRTPAFTADARRGSASDVICWQTAAPDDYYDAAHVELQALEIPDIDGNTWVHVAVESKNAAVVADLLSRVDNRLVQHQNKDGTTPLHLAAKRDARDVAVVLLARGADALCKDAAGHNPLAAACRFGASCSLVTLLLHESQASINDADCNGDTPLMTVIAEHHNHLLEILMHAPLLDWTRQDASAHTITQIAQTARNSLACELIAQVALAHGTTERDA